MSVHESHGDAKVSKMLFFVLFLNISTKFSETSRIKYLALREQCTSVLVIKDYIGS